METAFALGYIKATVRAAQAELFEKRATDLTKTLRKGFKRSYNTTYKRKPKRVAVTKKKKVSGISKRSKAIKKKARK